MLLSNVGKNTNVHHPGLVNIYGAKIGSGCSIGAFVEIGPAVIGDNCRIGAFSFIPEGVTIMDFVTISPRVTFCNDKYPPSHGKWRKKDGTIVEDYASIGAGSVILPGLIIGKGSIVGAGSVVTKNVQPYTVVAGNPAIFLRQNLVKKDEIDCCT